MQITSSVLQTRVGLSGCSCRLVRVSFLPSTSPPSSAPARAAAGEEGSAGCLMHMQMIFLLPPASPAPPAPSSPASTPPPRPPPSACASCGFPAAFARLDVQSSELWSGTAVSQKEACARSWNRRGKGRKVLSLKSSRRSSLRLAEQGRKASKMPQQVCRKVLHAE